MFGKWLKEQRLILGLTQREFANFTGLTEVLINNFENNKKTPGIKAMNNISNFLGISVYELRLKMEEQNNG